METQEGCDPCGVPSEQDITGNSGTIIENLFGVALDGVTSAYNTLSSAVTSLTSRGNLSGMTEGSFDYSSGQRTLVNSPLASNLDKAKATGNALLNLAALYPGSSTTAGIFSETPGVGPSLVRLGKDAESAERLAAQAAYAEANGFPHGVSTKQVNKPAANDLRDGKIAKKSDVQKVFKVTQTGKKASHHTVELPKPVTQEIADWFNNLFTPHK